MQTSDDFRQAFNKTNAVTLTDKEYLALMFELQQKRFHFFRDDGTPLVYRLPVSCGLVITPPMRLTVVEERTKEQGQLTYRELNQAIAKAIKDLRTLRQDRKDQKTKPVWFKGRILRMRHCGWMKDEALREARKHSSRYDWHVKVNVKPLP